MWDGITELFLHFGDANGFIYFLSTLRLFAHVSCQLGMDNTAGCLYNMSYSHVAVDSENNLPTEYLNSDLAKESQTKSALSESEVKRQEEEELQLAVAKSLSEESKYPKKKAWTTLPKSVR